MKIYFRQNTIFGKTTEIRSLQSETQRNYLLVWCEWARARSIVSVCVRVLGHLECDVIVKLATILRQYLYTV